jgi:hypothetical protein
MPAISLRHFHLPLKVCDLPYLILILLSYLSLSLSSCPIFLSPYPPVPSFSLLILLSYLSLSLSSCPNFLSPYPPILSFSLLILLSYLSLSLSSCPIFLSPYPPVLTFSLLILLSYLSLSLSSYPIPLSLVGVGLCTSVPFQESESASDKSPLFCPTATARPPCPSVSSMLKLRI